MVAADNSAKLPGRYITNRQESAIERVSLLCMLDERGVTRFPGLDDAQAEGNSALSSRNSEYLRARFQNHIEGCLCRSSYGPEATGRDDFAQLCLTSLSAQRLSYLLRE